MNDFNMFCYMDSTFLQVMDLLIQQVCQLRLVDFEKQEGDDVECQAYDGHIHPHLNASPFRLSVSFLFTSIGLTRSLSNSHSINWKSLMTSI